MKTLLSALLMTGMMLGQAQVSDVPAIHVPAESVWQISGDEHGMFITSSCTNNGKRKDEKCIGGWRWGCADKSAILLTAEDGKRHCLKLGTTVPVKSAKP